MKQLLSSISKRPSAAYRSYADRRRTQRQARRFRQWSDEDQLRAEFYQQFVAAGDVVFDVGANLGNRAKIFSRLGAKVIAVEPQTACADFLQMVFQDADNFHLVRKALGASAGKAEMLISSAHTVSSLSTDWVRSVQESGRFADCQWNRTEQVAIDTLDNLIAVYGCPAFIKIDVEGYEAHVVSGLSMPVNAISMEFTPEFAASTRRCIAHLCRIGDYRFQLSLDESMEFLLADWVSASEIERVLGEVPPTAFGDLYARCR